MATAGRTGVLEIGPTVAGLVDVTGDASGLDGFDKAEPLTERRIPGGGRTAHQGTGHRGPITHSFTIDVNATTLPLLWGKNGTELYVRWSRDGDSTGDPYVQYRTVAQVSVTFEAQGAVRFAVETSVREEPTPGMH